MGDWELIVEPEAPEPERHLAELACFYCGDRLDVPFCVTCGLLTVGTRELMAKINIEKELRALL